MTFDIFAKFATDESLETGGVWKDIGDGARLLIARAGNKEYGKQLQAAVEKHDAVLKLRNDEADKKSDEIMAEVAANTLLLGWEGVSYRGKPLEYSKANAKLVLKHKDFRQLVMDLANDREAYLMKLEEEQGEA